ncbi:Arylsulfatase [Drechslerella dactyloides]|uniref:Arylsulfatase n=1 Tax=Drechslerella dactyloides TaxID=74499 RepID=A0AAD6IQG3_DREDA|nr:Arylsulfatase [Drechslerella dactyloides]
MKFLAAIITVAQLFAVVIAAPTLSVTNPVTGELEKRGYSKFVSQGFNDDFLPVWLQNAGYNTYYTGKLFNGHSHKTYNNPYVRGFTGSDFLLDPWTYDYLNPVYQHNQDPPTNYSGHHTSEVLMAKAHTLLNDAIASDKPFFLGLAPVAPHGTVIGNIEDHNITIISGEPIPLKRHAHLFPDAKVPRTPNFNPDSPSSVSWIAERPLLTQNELDDNDHFYRQRLRALQGVDELWKKAFVLEG